MKQKGPREPALHPWDRQISETPAAYNLFAVYRDMGINRNITDVAKSLGRKKTQIRNLSIANQWELRCGVFDDEENRKLEAELHYEIVAARRRHHRLGSMMLDFAQESIENLRAMGDLLSIRDLVLLTEAGHKIESVALGMTTDITENRVVGDLKVEQTESVPMEILERIGKEIAEAKSLGEEVAQIEAEFEELAPIPGLLADDNGNGNGEKIPVKA